MKQAAYCNGVYFLLPEDFPDFESFQAYLQSAQMPVTFQAVVLREDHKVPCWTVFKGESIAPYFLSGYHDEPSTVQICDASNVYPTSVEILDQDAYNARLRELIEGYCPGCKRFKPLTNRVQSLNGHHGEISLDGVCFFRYETNPSPRIFHELLFSFGGFFKRNRYAQLGPEEMREKLSWMYLRFQSVDLQDTETGKLLTVECKKKELLAPILVPFLSEYLLGIGENYRIQAKTPCSCTEEMLQSLVSEETTDALRKELKKYGLSIGILEYDAAAAEKVRASLEDLEDHFYIHPLALSPGRDWYLFTDTPYVLKALHYHTPLLETYGTTVTVHSQNHTARYHVSFHMPREILS